MKKMLALLLATTLTAATIAGCGSGKTDAGSGTQAPAQTEKAGETAGGTGTAEAPAAGADTLKLAVTTGDGSTTDDRIPTPWYNRIMATNLMYT